MRRTVIGLSIIVFGTASLAEASDLSPQATISHIQSVNWAGLYLGGQVGGGWIRNQRTTSTGFVSKLEGGGAILGGQIGYNWELPTKIVIGIEGDVAWTSFNGDEHPEFNGGTDDDSNIRFQGSLRGRIGYAFDQYLLYGTGGWAFGRLTWRNNNPAPAGGIDVFANMLNGWTLGAGIERALWQHWSVRAEYRYSDYGRMSRPTPANGIFPYKATTATNQITLGVNYHF